MTAFWDTSALLPLVRESPESVACRRVRREDARLVVWCLTQTEAISSLCRQHRSGVLDEEELRRAEARLESLAAAWDEVDALTPVREQAERVLRVHALKAADALQLGAALVAVDLRPKRRRFVTLDEALAASAGREGFAVIVPCG